MANNGEIVGKQTIDDETLMNCKQQYRILYDKTCKHCKMQLKKENACKLGTMRVVSI